MGWLLFIIDIALFIGGGLLEMVNETLGLVVLLLGFGLLIVLWRGDRRGWFG